MMSLSEKEKQNALNEVRLLASINHPNIVGYKESFIDEPSATLCLVMEYADNGDILSKIQEHQKKGTNFKESEIWNYFAQMLLGMKAVHDMKICHRDIKSANIFLNMKGEIKLGDFNVSKVAKKGMLYTQTGTPYYASPEVWKDRPYDHKSDIWSLGCVLYEMIMLRPPFKSTDMKGLYKKVVSVDYPPVNNPKFSQDLSNLVKIILQGNPILRPSCISLLQMQSFQKQITDPLVLEQVKNLKEIKVQLNQNDGELLETIKLPRALKQLQDKLPKANYRRQQSLPATRIAATNIINSRDHSNPITPKYDKEKIINDIVNSRPISGRAGLGIQKHPSLNGRLDEKVDYKPSKNYHQYYEDQFGSYDNKENVIHNYEKYRKGMDVLRRHSDNNVIEIQERKRQEQPKIYSNERQQLFNNYVANDYSQNNPYGAANYQINNYAYPQRASRNIPTKYDYLR